MILSKDNFYETTLGYFTPISKKIEEVTTQSFQDVFESKDVKGIKGIVYIWQTKKKISRLYGESDILYIGQTKNSFNKRYYNMAEIFSSAKANELKFKKILELYGPITISIFQDYTKLIDINTIEKKHDDTSMLRQAEGQMLWWYFQNHCEYPPLNYTKTSIRNDFISVN